MSLWSDSGKASRFEVAGRGGARGAAIRRVEDWTRERFALGAGDTVVITENARALPGFPPRETVVGFWTADGTRHHFRVFKRIEDVSAEDVPPAWLKASLAWDGFDCECC
jgi:hypothetical protein